MIIFRDCRCGDVVPTNYQSSSMQAGRQEVVDRSETTELQSLIEILVQSWHRSHFLSRVCDAITKVVLRQGDVEPACSVDGTWLFESRGQDDLGNFGFLLPISQPHPLRVFTTFGRIAAVSGTRMKMKDLCIA